MMKFIPYYTNNNLQWYVEVYKWVTVSSNRGQLQNKVTKNKQLNFNNNNSTIKISW